MESTRVAFVAPIAQALSSDSCDIQFIYQGRDPNINTDYGRLPYRLGLITLSARADPVL